jgi:hypothetical protein
MMAAYWSSARDWAGKSISGPIFLASFLQELWLGHIELVIAKLLLLLAVVP